ncbi:transposase [Candidatus Protochlamydia naegleriophila]|uniref:transposase n=1 Tax=Candidatus Protochlamydia naegleriophila TaxID=389348 RepID=UPI00073F7660
MMIKDKDWEKILPLLPGGPGKQGRPPKNIRLTVEGIFWALRTGVPWRDLPKEFGSWKTVVLKM